MLELLDYRRRVAELYQTVRDTDGDAETWEWFRNQRGWLFQAHPQSALDADQKRRFRSLSYFEYDPAFRVIAELDTNVEPEVVTVDLGDDGQFTYRRLGRVEFYLPTGNASLYVYWIMGYGGGVFLPFADATSGHETYGGGRYLYDTIKGADLGTSGRSLVMDFNYAYNPSCAYNARWVCPLAPVENRLTAPIMAGERMGTY